MLTSLQSEKSLLATTEYGHQRDSKLWVAHEAKALNEV